MRTKRKWLIIAAAILAIIACPVSFFLGSTLFQRPSVELVADGKVVAVVRQPLLRPNWDWEGFGHAAVYIEKEKVFSLAENYLVDGGPIFIYPFAGGKRFLCDYDDDTSMLDFVVDFRDSATNESRSSGWPPNDIGEGNEIGLGNYTKTHMASRIPNVVFETRGFVRLPNYAELAEVRSYLTATNSTHTKAAYFSFWSKESLLLDLDANRKSVWPIKK